MKPLTYILLSMVALGRAFAVEQPELNTNRVARPRFTIVKTGGSVNLKVKDNFYFSPTSPTPIHECTGFDLWTEPFCMTNRCVNRLILDQYENDPGKWGPEFHYLLGMLYLVESQFEKGTTLLKQYTSIHTNDVRALIAVAVSDKALGREEESGEFFLKAWNISRDSRALSGLALHYLQTNQLDAFAALIPFLLEKEALEHGLRQHLIVYSLASHNDDGSSIFNQVVSSITKEEGGVKEFLTEFPLIAPTFFLAHLRFRKCRAEDAFPEIKEMVDDWRKTKIQLVPK